MGRTVKALCAAAVLAFAGVAAGAETAEFVNPVLRVPKMAAPTIDGVVSPDEWKGAAAVTGFAAGGPGSTNSLVPEIQQVVWYLGFDEKYLYLAMRSPHAKGTYPVARVKDADSIDVLFEDHVEVQICPFDRTKATRPGVGFFKMMVNPKGAMIDQHYFNGTVGTEELWSTGGEVKCSVTEDRWDLEMSIEIARLRTQKLDGRDLTIQLVRTDSCNGIYFAGLVNATWLEWKRFAKVDFDAAAPVFQFLRLGEVMAGALDAAVRVTGNGPAPQEVEVELAVEDASGKPLFREKQAATVKPGESRTLAWKAAGLAVSPVPVGGSQRNHVEITASYRSGGKTIVLYHNRSPFVRLDDEFRKKQLEPWLAGRPQSGEWEYRVAYLPYAGRTEVSVDLDFFGVPKAVAAASLFSVDFRKKGAAKPLAAAEAPIRNLAGSVLFPVGDLPEAEYEIVIRLRDAGGKTVSQKTAAVERKKYPWERNTIGCSDEVIPPFTPVSVKDRSFSVWGRTYTIAGSGLPEQIAAAPPTGTVGTVQNLLRAPVRLEASAGGKPVELKTGQAAVSAEGPHRALAVGSVEGGPLAVKTKAFGEYDGWYQVEMTVEPRGNGAIDALDLVFDMRDSTGDAWNAPMPVDTLYVQRMGDGRYGNRFGGIPRAAGVHFRSSDLLRCREGGKDWKSFAPIAYVGNGDRGLWFFAWSDAGWRLTDDRPMLQVERLADGTVRCRVCLFAGPAPPRGAPDDQVRPAGRAGQAERFPLPEPSR